MQTTIRLTEDGSHTLHVPEIDECYHSTHGAIQESMHIFIRAGLLRFLSAAGPDVESDAERAIESVVEYPGKVQPLCVAGECPDSSVNILEIGFGTGLNAYLTLLEAEKRKIPIHYTSLELYPLPVKVALGLNYPEALQEYHDNATRMVTESPDVCTEILPEDADSVFREKRQLFEQLHSSPWEEDCEITSYFTLHKIKTDFTGYGLQGMFDVIYFDAFSPEKQPEMWVEDGFRKISEHVNEGAVLTTYCAKGVVRRALQSAGFVVERLPGPPGKREILRGRK